MEYITIKIQDYILLSNSKLLSVLFTLNFTHCTHTQTLSLSPPPSPPQVFTHCMHTHTHTHTHSLSLSLPVLLANPIFAPSFHMENKSLPMASSNIAPQQRQITKITNTKKPAFCDFESKSRS